MSTQVLSEAVTLDTPVVRGEVKIEKVQIRKPQGGELRGVSLMALGHLEVNDLIKVLPRLAVPALFEHEVAAMDPADLLSLGVEVAGFLLPKGPKTASPDA